MCPLKPDQYFRSITEISPAKLLASGINNLLVDLEGTLVPRDTWELSPATSYWIKEAVKAGLRICLLSNTVRARKSLEFASKLEVPVISFSFKPLPFAFRKGLRILGGKLSDTAIIGDQLFMDILGGKLSGIRTILVRPVSEEKFPLRKLMRWVEGLFFRAGR